MAVLRDFVALSLLPISSWRDIGSALKAGEPPGPLLDRLAAAADERCASPGRGADLRPRAEVVIRNALDAGLDAVAWSDPEYPPALAAIFDPPPVLWLRGRRGVFARTSVAIVGSRAASPYALAVGEELAGDLAARGISVVSGLARGVDSAAHRGALRRGVTVAVLGSGADVIYPAEHKPLAAEIAVDGAVVSELAPGTPPHPMFFPRRNRLISGLVRAVVVIEAGQKSGSLITARCALEQGRDVLAVPGNVLDGRNRGGHALLRDGARIVETADDIVEELGLAMPAASPAGSGNQGSAAGSDPILACLPAGEACDLDEIAERSGLTAARLLPRLLDLELQGRVRRAGGGRFVRFDRSC